MAQVSELSDGATSVLLKIYIGQNIRDEGILQSDFYNFKKEVEELRSKGLIKENHWYLYQYLTTEEGSKIGKKLVDEQLNKNYRFIQDNLSKLPRKALKFLIRRHVQKALRFNYEQPLYSIKWDELPISDSRIWLLRKNLFDTLKDAGLCVITHYYVATRGGEIRDKHYVISPEVQEFLFDLPILKPKEDDGLTENEKRILKVYSFLKEISYILDNADLDLIRRRFYEHLSNLSMDETSISKIVDEMSKSGITSKYHGLLSSTKPFEIKDKSKYDIYLKEKLLNSVSNSLLGQKVKIIKFETRPAELSEAKIELGILDKKERAEFYLLVSSVEQKLREFIKEGLGRKWLKRLEKDCPKVVENWREKEEKDKKWGIEPEKELINYADFGDYKEIFKKYRKIFSESDEDLGDVVAQLKNWYNYGRNPVMHFRTVNREKFHSTKAAISWIEAWISRRKKSWETSQ